MTLYVDTTYTLQKSAGIPGESNALFDIFQSQYGLKCQAFIVGNTNKTNIVHTLLQALTQHTVSFTQPNPLSLNTSLSSQGIRVFFHLPPANLVPIPSNSVPPKDIYLFQGFYYIQSPYKNMIIRYHDAFPYEFPKMARNALVTKFVKAFINRIAPQVTLVCNSEDTRKRLFSLNPKINPENTTVIYPPYIPLNTSGVLPPHTPTHYLLCVSRFEPRKNLNRFITAYIQSKITIPLVLVASYGWGSQSLYTQVKSHPHIQLFETVSESTLQALYTHAQAFFFPSIAEGFGKPPMEALWAHCAIAISDIPAHKEVYKNVPDYFNPTDIQTIINALQLFADPIYAKKKALKQYNQFMDFAHIYTPRTIGKQWYGVIEKIKKCVYTENTQSK